MSGTVVSVDASLCGLKCEGAVEFSSMFSMALQHPLNDARGKNTAHCFLEGLSDAAFHVCCLFVGGCNGSMTHVPHCIGHNYLMCHWRNVSVFPEGAQLVHHSLSVVHTSFLFTVIPQQPIHPCIHASISHDPSYSHITIHSSGPFFCANIITQGHLAASSPVCSGFRPHQYYEGGSGAASRPAETAVWGFTVDIRGSAGLKKLFIHPSEVLNQSRKACTHSLGIKCFIH